MSFSIKNVDRILVTKSEIPRMNSDKMIIPYPSAVT